MWGRSIWRCSARFSWLHFSTAHVQNLVTFCLFWLWTPLLDIVVFGIVCMPKSMSGSKSIPNIRWLPFMVPGWPKECIHVAVIAVAASGLPAIKSMAWLPLWCVASFRKEGYRWWCRLTRSVSVNRQEILDLGSSTGLLASMQTMASFCAIRHELISWIRSVRKSFRGLGFAWPCCWSKRVCCAVVVFDAASNFWWQTRYPDTTKGRTDRWES